jgi:hypothetical protein
MSAEKIKIPNNVPFRLKTNKKPTTNLKYIYLIFVYFHKMLTRCVRHKKSTQINVKI